MASSDAELWEVRFVAIRNAWLDNDLALSERLLEASRPEFEGSREYRLARVHQAVLGAPSEGDRDNLKTEIARLADEFPTDIVVLVLAAGFSFDLKDYRQAVKFTRYVRPLLGPNYEHLPEEHAAAFFFMLGGLAMEAGQLEEAEIMLRDAFDREPEQQPHGVELARVLIKLKKFTEARDVVSRALEQSYQVDQLRLLSDQLFAC